MGSSARVALDEIREVNNIILYPNKVSDFATVTFDKPIDVEFIHVFDITGRLLRSYDPRTIRNGRDYIIDVKRYEQGVYIVKMIDDVGGSFDKQMIVRRE